MLRIDADGERFDDGQRRRIDHRDGVRLDVGHVDAGERAGHRRAEPARRGLAVEVRGIGDRRHSRDHRPGWRQPVPVRARGRGPGAGRSGRWRRSTDVCQRSPALPRASSSPSPSSPPTRHHRARTRAVPEAARVGRGSRSWPRPGRRRLAPRDRAPDGVHRLGHDRLLDEPAQLRARPAAGRRPRRPRRWRRAPRAAAPAGRRRGRRPASARYPGRPRGCRSRDPGTRGSARARARPWCSPGSTRRSREPGSARPPSRGSGAAPPRPVPPGCRRCRR